MFRHKRTHGSSKSRRKLGWADANFAVPASSLGAVSAHSGIGFWLRAPAGVLDTSFTPSRLVEEDHTLTKMRINCNFDIRFPVVGYYDIQLAIGVITWDGRNDTDPPFTECPFPTTEAGFDWTYIWRNCYSGNSIAVGQQLLYQNQFGAESLISSKAQRKLSAGTGILLVVDIINYAGSAGAVNWAAGMQARGLFRLP